MSFTGPVLTGIGQLGEDVGKGAEANVLQQHQFTMDYLANQARNRQLGMEQQNLDQQNSIAHSQLQLEASRQDLERQQFERQGLQYTGSVSDSSGNYYRSYMDPLRGTSIKMPYPPGVVPMDSPQGMINSRKVLTDAKIPEDVVDRLLFKVGATNDPTEQLSSLIAFGKSSGAIDPEMDQNKAISWALPILREIRGGFSAFDPLGLGGQGGWTPSEVAEFNQLVTQPMRDSETTYRNQMTSYNEMINKLPPVSPIMDRFYAKGQTPREIAMAQAEAIRKSAEDTHTGNLQRLQQLGQQLTLTYNARHGNGPFRSTGPAAGATPGGGAAQSGLVKDDAGNIWDMSQTPPVWKGKAAAQ